MSGAPELILGIIPLALTAIQHYQNAAGILRAMREYKETFMDLHLLLRTSMAIYSDSMEQVLSPLPMAKSVLEGYLGSEDVLKLWDDPIYGEELKKILGKRWYTYHDLIESLFRKLKEFVYDLRLNKEYQPLWLNHDGSIDRGRGVFFTAHPKLWLKIRSGLKKGSFQVKIKAIEEDVDRIRKMVAAHTGSEQQRAQIPFQRIRVPLKERRDGKCFKRVTEAARTFYGSLNTLWPASCSSISCRFLHRASLPITDRQAPGLSKKKSTLADQGGIAVNLEILFLLDEAGKPPAWNWRAVNVELEERGRRKLESIEKAPEAPTVVAKNRSSKPAKRQVHFEENKENTPAQLIVASSTANRIENLCRSLKLFTCTIINKQATAFHQGAIKSCIGFLEGTDHLHYLYGTAPPPCCNSKGKTITLRKILNGGWPYPLGSNEKSMISYQLANAVLQFHDTPWLQGDWTAEDVEFILDGSHTLNQAQPIISKSFVQSRQDEDEPCRQKKVTTLVKNQLMFSLGLALLELYLGKPIQDTEEYRESIAETGGIQTAVTNYVAARQLLQVVQVREPSNVFLAIQNCVEIQTVTKTYSLEDDDFRDAFYDGVVVPLQTNYELLKSILG